MLHDDLSSIYREFSIRQRIGMDLFSIEREEKRKGSSFSSGPHHGTGVYTYLLLETRTKQSEDVSGREVYRAMAVADVMLVGHRILTAGVCVYISSAGRINGSLLKGQGYDQIHATTMTRVTTCPIYYSIQFTLYPFPHFTAILERYMQALAPFI